MTNSTPSFFSTMWTIAWKDLQIEKHTRQILSVMIMFSLVTVVMFNFALETNLAAARDVATGLLWATILLAGTLGLNRTMAVERENQAMDTLLMAPINRNAIYAGKVLSTTIFTLALEVVLVLLFIVFFNKPLWRPPVLLILFLGTIGYVAAGVLIASMSIQTRARDVLLPVLLLPLSLPLVLPAAMATAVYMFPQQPAFAEVQTPIMLIILYDVLMLTAGFTTYHYIVES